MRLKRIKIQMSLLTSLQATQVLHRNVDDLSCFLIKCFWICSNVILSESLLTQEKISTHLFLIFTICQADSSAIQLHVFNMTVAELKRFIESKEFVESEEFIEFKEFIESKKFVESKEFKDSEKSAQLYLNVSEYRNDLFL